MITLGTLSCGILLTMCISANQQSKAPVCFSNKGVGVSHARAMRKNPVEERSWMIHHLLNVLRSGDKTQHLSALVFLVEVSLAGKWHMFQSYSNSTRFFLSRWMLSRLQCWCQSMSPVGSQIPWLSVYFIRDMIGYKKLICGLILTFTYYLQPGPRDHRWLSRVLGSGQVMS